MSQTQGTGQGQSQAQSTSPRGQTSQDITKNLKGTKFPASRADLQQQAATNQAEEDVLLIIAVLPDVSYDTMDSVGEAVDQANQRSPRPTMLAHALKGVQFPARKDDLVRQAQQNGADQAVMDTIQALPDDEYHTMADVMKAFGAVH
jgi:hypothetical protein